MLLRSFIDKINESFTGLLPGIKVFGLAQSIVRTVGVELELLPGVVDRNGEIKNVDLDDADPVRIYHRNAGITVTRVAQRQGYGDEFNDVINTYQMAMIVYINHKRSKLFPEELFLLLQSNLPDALKSEPYKSIYIRPANVILNSQLVFAAEYSGTTFKLPPEHSLFQINYTIETTFAKKCFEKCPEECK